MEQKIITSFIKAKMANGLSQTTIDSYCYALKDYWQYLCRNGVETVTESVIEDYFIFLQGKNYSKTTLRDKYAVLHAYYQYAVNHGYYKENPLKIKKPKASNDKIKVFTEEEVCRILSYFTIRDTFTKLRDYAVICTLLSTGVRRSELLAMSDLTGGSINILGKGNKSRILPISASLKVVLKPYLIERNKIACCPQLFVTRDGTAIGKDGLRAIFTRLSNNTGVKISTHKFRHTYATIALSNGLPIHNLQYFLGHSSVSTTQIYLHYADKTAQEINNKTNPLNNFKIFL